MNIQDQVSLEHLLFRDRECSVCGEVKDLISDYYLIRKSKPHRPSSYSYECKDCAVLRVRKKRQSNSWEYPDW